MPVQPVPEGYHTVTCISPSTMRRRRSTSTSASAPRSGRMAAPDGKIGHAELEIETR